jgi:hypothetical protein
MNCPERRGGKRFAPDPSLVGGGQALFGLKTRLQLGPLSLTALLSQKKGQTKELTATGGQQSSSQKIYPQGYSTYYYFVDTLYRKFWEPLHESQSPVLTDSMVDNQIVQLELWMSVPQSTTNVNKIFKAKAFIDLPSRAPSADYPDGLEDGLSQKPGEKYTGNFIKLEPDKDYRFRFGDALQANGGYIVLNTSIPEGQALAVTYTVLGHGNYRAYGTMNQTYSKDIDGLSPSETHQTALAGLKSRLPDSVEPAVKKYLFPWRERPEARWV